MLFLFEKFYIKKMETALTVLLVCVYKFLQLSQTRDISYCRTRCLATIWYKVPLILKVFLDPVLEKNLNSCYIYTSNPLLFLACTSYVLACTNLPKFVISKQLFTSSQQYWKLNFDSTCKSRKNMKNHLPSKEGNLFVPDNNNSLI